MINIDPITQLAFSVYENSGVFAVLLGSGLSRAAEIPTGWEITIDLIRRVALAEGAEEQEDWGAWYRASTGEEPNYSDLLERLASSPEERRAILHRYIEPTAEDIIERRKIPTAAHHAIAELVRGGYIRLIITTNFDRLMENALRERGIEPTVVSSVDGLAGAEPLTHTSCYVLKLHGDYKDARILNTEPELSEYPVQYNVLLDRLLDEHGLIVCGWSGEWDYALRAALLRAPNRRYSLFWTSRGAPGSGAQELIDHRRGRVVPIADADSLFRSLNQRVQTLEQSQRQNPLTIELMISSAKRFLAKSEFRIQLDELLTQEADRVLLRLNSSEFAMPGQWDQTLFRAYVRKYEAVVEGLACMSGVLGRWGDGGELPLILDVIRSIYAQAKVNGSGLTRFINLRSYPAVLVFTAYGLGLTRAERWSTLHSLLNAMIDRQQLDAVRTVEVLFLNEWEGASNDAFKQVEGLDKRKTPLSDHLLSVFEKWSRSFVGLVPDFPLLFERFECLGSLAHLSRSKKSEISQALAGEPHNGWVWMPVGRSGWNGSNATKLMAEMQAEPLRSELVNAKFGEGDTEIVDLFTKNFTRIAGRMRF